MNNQEVWKDIPTYPKYQISNHGRVISYQRKNPKILNTPLNHNGYKFIELRNGDKPKQYKIHQLVIWVFKGIKPNGMKHTIDHIDGNKLNNSLDNLEIVSLRENTSRYFINRKTTSQYTGVHWHKSKKKYSSEITINRKKYHLGYSKNDSVCWIYYVRVLDHLNNHTNEETIQYIKTREYKTI